MGWPYTKNCTRCHGHKTVKHWWSGKPRTCPRCEGSGRMWTMTYILYSRLRYGKDSG
jgi:DnaJ-class molecular chaperone